MATRKTPSMTDILEQFRQAQSKTASDPEACPEEGACAPVTPEEVAAAEAAEAAAVEAPATADDVAAAADAVEAAQEAVVDAKETLQEVADEFINEHTAALKKEAQVFGELFAASVMGHMNKQATLQNIEQDAYAFTRNALGGQSALEKCAAVYDQAYMITMAKIAGYDSPEEMQEALGYEDQLTPEDMAAMTAQMPEEGPAPEAELEPEPEPAVGPVAAALEAAAEAAEANSEAIEAIAEAARLLSPQPEDEYFDAEGNPDLPRVAGEAYQNTMAQLGQQPQVA